MRFRAEETFFSPEVMSEYIKGQMYTVRPGNKYLANLVAIWLREAKVSVLSDEAAQPGTTPAQIGGVGVVQSAPIQETKPSLFERIKSWL